MKVLLKILGGLVLLVALFFASAYVSMLPNIPDEQWQFERTVADEPRNFLIFGATRNTGLEVARILTARGDRVTVFVRETSDRSEVEPLGVNFAVGDALEPATVAAAFAADNYDAVLTTIGGFRGPNPPDFEGNRNIFDAAKNAGVDRVIMISTIGAGDSNVAIPWVSNLMLSDVARLKTEAEDHLKAGGLAYTIIRPGGLPFDVGTGGGILTEDPEAFGFIAREDLARLVVAAFDDGRTAGRTFSAMDPARTTLFYKAGE